MESRHFCQSGKGGRGHKEHKPWDSDWAVNDEMLRNFAHEQLKKTHDAVVQITDFFMKKKQDTAILWVDLMEGGKL